MAVLRQIFSNVWMLLAGLSLVGNLFFYSILNVTASELKTVEKQAATYRAQLNTAVSFNDSLNATVDRIQADAIANQKLMNDVFKERAFAEKQLAADVAVIRKGFADAKDDCQFHRPPAAVVERVRSIYARDDHKN